MTEKQSIYREMRERAGGRPRLYKLTGASVSTIQAWEDGKNDPQGPTTARLILIFPDLADRFIRALAAGPEFDATNPPVVPPATSKIDAARAATEALRAAEEAREPPRQAQGPRRGRR